MPNSSLRVWSLGLKEVDLEGGLGISGVNFFGVQGLEFWVAKGFYRVSGLVGFRVRAEGVGVNGCGNGVGGSGFEASRGCCSFAVVGFGPKPCANQVAALKRIIMGMQGRHLNSQGRVTQRFDQCVKKPFTVLTCYSDPQKYSNC